MLAYWIIGAVILVLGFLVGMVAIPRFTAKLTMFVSFPFIVIFQIIATPFIAAFEIVRDNYEAFRESWREIDEMIDKQEDK